MGTPVLRGEWAVEVIVRTHGQALAERAAWTGSPGTRTSDQRKYILGDYSIEMFFCKVKVLRGVLELTVSALFH